MKGKGSKAKVTKGTQLSHTQAFQAGFLNWLIVLNMLGWVEDAVWQGGGGGISEKFVNFELLKFPFQP